MPYISEYTIVEDGDVYRIRLTDTQGNCYDSTVDWKLGEALDFLEALKKGDGHQC